MLTDLLEYIKTWRFGVRLYIAIGIGLVTLETIWWAQSAYGGSNLVSIRIEEVFAWLALALLVLAMMIGPAYKLFPQLPAKLVMRDARRMIGIGAAWFASLHAAIAYLALLEAPNPFNLPGVYQRSFVVGVSALVILLALAFTSFDRAFRGMGIWWFRLHRLVYAAVILSVLHAFIVGVHATSWFGLILLTACALLLLGMHIILYIVQPAQPKFRHIITLSITVLILVAVFNYGYGQL